MHGQEKDSYAWKLEKTLDRVEQGEPKADHIIIAVLPIGYSYRVHTYMQEL